LHSHDTGPTEEEIDFASGKVSLDTTEFLKKLDNASMKIQDAFARQVLVCVLLSNG
jgi:2-iminoacetate synthase ThiH